MAKLTRYNSFEELKSDVQPNTLTEAERDRVYAELEEFIKLLQQDLALLWQVVNQGARA